MKMRYKIPASILPFFQSGAANVSPSPRGDGGTGTVCAAIRDIAVAKRPGGKLQQALNLVEGVLNAVPDILFEVDREGRVEVHTVVANFQFLEECV